MESKIEERLKAIRESCPFVPHTNAGRLYSTVRRMKAEKEKQIPLPLRSSFAISIEDGVPANELDEECWEQFYASLHEAKAEH